MLFVAVGHSRLYSLLEPKWEVRYAGVLGACPRGKGLLMELKRKEVYLALEVDVRLVPKDRGVTDPQRGV